MKLNSKILFFVIPLVVCGIVFSTLNILYPEDFNIWLSFLISILFASMIKLWQENTSFKSELKAEIEKYGKSLKLDIRGIQKGLGQKSMFFETPEKIFYFLANHINSPNDIIQNLSIYRGYSHSFENEEKYFQKTIEAIEENKIRYYYRAMSVRNSTDIINILKIMRLLSSNELARERTTFYLCYKSNLDYLTFLTFGDDKCFTIFPNLDVQDRNSAVSEHRYASYIEHQGMTKTLQGIFNHIISLRSSVKTSIPELSNENDWKELIEGIIIMYNQHNHDMNIVFDQDYINSLYNEVFQ